MSACARCGVLLPSLLTHTCYNLIRKLPEGGAELLGSGQHPAVGRHLLSTDRFLPVYQPFLANSQSRRRKACAICSPLYWCSPLRRLSLRTRRNFQAPTLLSGPYSPSKRPTPLCRSFCPRGLR